MNYYVYIIESLVDGTFYKGYTLDFNERLKQHNEGWSHYTSRKIPWKLGLRIEYDENLAIGYVLTIFDMLGNKLKFIDLKEGISVMEIDISD
jgi:hypothetical protein